LIEEGWFEFELALAIKVYKPKNIINLLDIVKSTYEENYL